MTKLLSKTSRLYLMLLVIAMPSNMKGQNVSQERMEWWSTQKFGMFIHYGPWFHHNDRITPTASTKGAAPTRTPIKTPEEAMRSFCPVGDAPEQWVKLAIEAGMRYVVLTTKHPSSYGFPLWRTKTTDFCITSPECPYSNQPNPDFIDKYVKAARNEELGIGFYLSWIDGQWILPGSTARFFVGDGVSELPHFLEKNPERWAEFLTFEKAQIRELLTQYGSVDYFWFDGGFNAFGRQEDALPILKMMRELQPGIILNDRGTMNMADVILTPESFIPRTAPTGYWETCMPLAGRGGWIPPEFSKHKEWMTIGAGWYDYQGPDMEYKTIKELIQALCVVASKGGNLLLNVGPKPDGTIPEHEVELLQQMGQWLKVNGEAIYGTERSPFKTLPEWGVITRKGQKIYLHVFDWPERTGILPFDVKNNIISAKLLATGEVLTINRINSETVEIHLPFEPAEWEPNIRAIREAPNEYSAVVVLEVEGDIQY